MTAMTWPTAHPHDLPTVAERRGGLASCVTLLAFRRGLPKQTVQTSGLAVGAEGPQREAGAADHDLVGMGKVSGAGHVSGATLVRLATVIELRRGGWRSGRRMRSR